MTSDIAIEAFMAGMAYAEDLTRWRDGKGTPPEAADRIKAHIDGRSTRNGLTGRDMAEKYARAAREEEKP